MDAKLNWREHINKKRKQIDLRVRKLYWLLGKKSQMPLENKIPLWTYGI